MAVNKYAIIEDRQSEIAALHGELFPVQAQRLPPPAEWTPSSLDDRSLVEHAMQAANGMKFATLWQGDVTGYGSRSEADLALCGMLAFWAGPDRARIDRLYRQSGIYREKWEREDYRLRTISAALSGRTEFYAPAFSRNRHRDGWHEDDRDGGDRNPVPALSVAYEPGEFHLTDLGNAKRFVARHGHGLLFSIADGKWLHWSGTHWAIDDTGEAERRAKETVLSIYDESRALMDQAVASAKTGDRSLLDAEGDAAKALKRQADAVWAWAAKSESAERLRALLWEAKSEAGVPVRADRLDADPWLFNVLNGTIDLRSLELRPHRPEDLITMVAPVQ